MRIVLDDPVPDDPKEREQLEAAQQEYDDAEESPDGFVIRRDDFGLRRRRKPPRDLTPAQLRVLAVALALVIIIAVASLTAHLLQVRRNATRLPSVQTYTPPAAPPSASQVPQAPNTRLTPGSPSGSVRDRDLSDDRPADAEQAGEGIH